MFEDNRTQYTKKIIQQSFFELLKTTPLKKITVKSICDHAKINRSTFYRYYMDVYDLLDKIEYYLVSQFYEYANNTHSLEEGLRFMLEEVQKNNEFYSIFSSVSQADGSFTEKISNIAYNRFKNGFSARFPELSETEQKWSFYFLISGSMTVTQQWIKDGLKEPVDEVVALVSALYSKII